MSDSQRPYVLNPRGHTWMWKDGSLDIFAYDCGWHNGPRCATCGYGFCHHCQPEALEDCPHPYEAPNV